MRLEKAISKTTRYGIMLAVLTFLLSLIPFSGTTSTATPNQQSVKTELVLDARASRKKAFAISSFRQQLLSSVAAPPLSEIHSRLYSIQLKNSTTHTIPNAARRLLRFVFIAESDEHLIA